MMNPEKVPKKHATGSVAVTCRGLLERVKDHKGKKQKLCKCSLCLQDLKINGSNYENKKR